MKKTRLLFATLASIFMLASCTPSTNENENVTITFNSNGGTLIESQTIGKGEKIVKPNNPEKDGYTFDKWTYMGEEWSFIAYSVTEDMTLDANWNIVYYTISYDLNGGTLDETNPSSYTVEDSVIFYNPSLLGYSFCGWYDQNNNKVDMVSKGSTGNLVLKARWDLVDYHVYFETNGGNEISPVVYHYGDTVDLPTPSGVLDLFVGWYLDKELTQEVTELTMPAKDITLYAKWSEMYTVFELNSKQYMYFGSYPQSVVIDESLISELSKITTTNSRGYYEYAGNEYAKKQVNACSSSYTYANGSSVTNYKIEYFKVEPILWRVLASDTSGNYTLLAEQALNAHEYDDLNSYSNSELNYKESSIRDWMNNDFFNAAFKSAEKGAILTTNVDNSASTTDSISNLYFCENTDDKVFLLSYKDYLNADYGFSTSYYSSDANRCCKPTDYAIANYCGMCQGGSRDRNCYYWTRSALSDFSGYAWYVNWTGSLFHGSFRYDEYGVRPALNINLK